jgi:hypothetical protein
MLNLSSHQRKKDIQNAFSKIQPEAIIQIQDGGESFLQEIEDAQEEAYKMTGVPEVNANLLDELKLSEFDLIEVIMTKFNMSR